MIRTMGCETEQNARRAFPVPINRSSLTAMRWVALWLVFLGGCNSQRIPQELAVMVSGDTAGWITPCGCAANQSGGLARRATLLDRQRQTQALVYLDAGGSASGVSEYHLLKLDAILRGMQKMGLAAHNVGSSETLLTSSQLADLSTQTGVTWISANLTSANAAPSGVAAPLKSHVLMNHGAAKLAVIGVIDPRLVQGSHWQARDPKAAILQVLNQVEADLVVVLAYFDEPGLRELAEGLPEVNLIIGGPTGQALSPTQVGSVTIAAATNKGKFLTRTVFRSEEPSWQLGDTGISEVVSALAENEDQKQNLERFYTELAKRDLTVDQAGLSEWLNRDQAGYRIAGSASCLQCHQADHATWMASRHQHAWEVLQSRRAHYDSYCQQCHTTGYGMDGGFVNVAQSKGLVSVGCENCHGPSAAHVADPKQKTPFLARDQCTRCHDHENSPQFQWDTYWPKIQHGRNHAANAAMNVDGNRVDARERGAHTSDLLGQTLSSQEEARP